MTSHDEQCTCGHRRGDHHDGKYKCNHQRYNPSDHESYPCGCRSFVLKETPKMVRPIKPDDIAIQKQLTIPPVIFETVNALIVENWRGKSATVLQKSIVERIKASDPGVAAVMFNRGWLDIEDAYRAEGWTVQYDKPGYNESYEAFFVFSKGQKNYDETP